MVANITVRLVEGSAFGAFVDRRGGGECGGPERSGGAKLIDIGCIQINQHWHGAHSSSVDETFDPEQNVQYAASYLQSLYQDAGSWTVAVARYRAGPGNPQAQRTYVLRGHRPHGRHRRGPLDPQRARFLRAERQNRIVRAQVWPSAGEVLRTSIMCSTSGREGGDAPGRCLPLAVWRFYPPWRAPADRIRQAMRPMDGVNGAASPALTFVVLARAKPSEN